MLTVPDPPRPLSVILSGFNRSTDHTQCSPISGRCQCSGIAVCEYSAARRHQNGAVLAHCLIGRDVFRMHALRFLNQILLDLRNGRNPDALEFFLHTANRPEQIHRRGPRLTDKVADPIEIALEIAAGFRLGEASSKSSSKESLR